MKTFYEIMLTSSSLILGVLFLHYIGKKRISARFSYLLWLPVIAKLLLFPRPIWNIRFSILNLETLFQRKFQGSTLPTQTEQTKQMAQKAAGIVSTNESLELENNSWSLLLGIWMAGMVLVIAWLLYNNYKMLQFLKQNRRYVQNYNGRCVYSVRGLSNSCLYFGTIYIDEELLEDKSKQRYVLLHEYCHLKQLDDVWAIARAGCLILYWYHPLVWAAAILSKRDCELACDEAVLRDLGEQHRIPYGETLLYFVNKYQEQRKNVKQLLALNTSINGGKKEMKERIQRIAIHKKESIITSLIIVGLMIVLTGCTFSGNQSQKSDGEADALKETEVSQEETQSSETNNETTKEESVVEVSINNEAADNVTVSLEKGGIGKVSTATLKVRNAASEDGDVVGLLGEGEEITILGKENGYYLISYEDNDNCYVDVQYITSEEEKK